MAEIRPPLITATLAVIVSFLPMFFITGMMGPYMRPMALERAGDDAHVDGGGVHDHALAGVPRAASGSTADGGCRQPCTITIRTTWMPIKQSLLYKVFYPLMAPLLHSRLVAWSFLLGMVLLTVGRDGPGGQRAACR